jgi:hypothetical protein
MDRFRPRRATTSPFYVRRLKGSKDAVPTLEPVLYVRCAAPGWRLTAGMCFARSVVALGISARRFAFESRLVSATPPHLGIPQTVGRRTHRQGDEHVDIFRVLLTDREVAQRAA